MLFQSALPIAVCSVTWSLALAGPPIDTSPDRAKTPLELGLKQIGTIRPRSANEIPGSNWTLGCETLDRDFADYQQYREYLVPLGIKTIRMLGDLGHDVESAVFTICDFNHTGREINHKGLLHATPDRKVDKIKLAYYSVQNCVAVFDDALERVQPPGVNVTFDRSAAAFLYRKRTTGQSLVVLWDNSGIPNDSFLTRPAQVEVKGCTFKEPVWVDLVSGRVYELPTGRVAGSGDSTIFDEVPLYDAPVLLAERGLLPLQPFPPSKQTP